MPAFTEIQIRAANPREKPYKLKDDRGLYLPIQPTGAKLWRCRYYPNGKENMLSFGTYPEVTLKPGP